MTAVHPGQHTLPDDDSGLIEAHLIGIEGAFDELFRRYHPRLVTYLTHRVGDAATADDLAQESLIRAMHALERFDTSRPVWPWLRRIATNAAIDWSRSTTRARMLVNTLSLEPARTHEGPDFGEREVMARAMEAVPDRQRHALEKCYVEGWRPVDVADQFGVGSNAFEQLLHRARRNLRRAYVRQDDGGDRAAGFIWLAMLASPFARALNAVRRLGVAGPRVLEVAAASVAIGAVVAVGPTGAPAPRTVVEAPVDRVERTTAAPDAPTAALPSAVSDVVDTVEAAAAPVGAPAPAPPSGAGRPAPVAPDAPAADAGAQRPVAPPLDDTPLDRGAEPDSPSAPEDPQSVPELIGGCGSAVRGALCTTIGVVSQ